MCQKLKKYQNYSLKIDFVKKNSNDEYLKKKHRYLNKIITDYHVIINQGNLDLMPIFTGTSQIVKVVMVIYHISVNWYYSFKPKQRRMKISHT